MDLDVLLDLAGGGYLALNSGGRAMILRASAAPNGTYGLPRGGQLVVRDGALVSIVPAVPCGAVYKPSP